MAFQHGQHLILLHLVADIGVDLASHARDARHDVGQQIGIDLDFAGRIYLNCQLARRGLGDLDAKFGPFGRAQPQPFLLVMAFFFGVPLLFFVILLGSPNRLVPGRKGRTIS